MWTCPLCEQDFVQENQTHSCNDRTVESFLLGKSPHIVKLFHYFVSVYQEMGPVKLHPAKHRIGLAARIRFAAVHRVGKDFIDIVFHFDERYDDNLCFHKIAPPAPSDFYNHYVRLYSKEDINEEVRYYMKMALEKAMK